ncbi:MAG: AAA domain-containing protein [Lachnospiraceae bacterium]
MNSVQRDIFKAIHEGKWLKIEYKNKEEKITNYWIGIRSINVSSRTLDVDGLHIGEHTLKHFPFIYIDSIISSSVIEGSYCEINQKLVADIAENPHRYQTLFDNVANLKILNYLEECNKMDTTPYHSDFSLIHHIDRDTFNGCEYQLNDQQFKEIVDYFEHKMKSEQKNKVQYNIQNLAMNVLSINTRKGLYVLAYRKLSLDVKRRILRPDEKITICSEYTLDGRKESVRHYLDADEYELLNDFEGNEELIKDCVTKHNNQVLGVDDMPYIIGIGMDVVLDLHSEYKAIVDMYDKNETTFPIRAFFGDLLERPQRRKAYPIALLNNNINLDQLLAINNAMKYPIAYIQGPPGTGKTNTIINTIITAFFNEKTVLFSSYNNVPIDGVFEKLSSLKYKDKVIPFPVLRLGNDTKMREAIKYIKDIYERSCDITVFGATLDKRKDDRIARAKRLAELLRYYEQRLDLVDRKDTLHSMLESQKNVTMGSMLAFNLDLQGNQLRKVEEKIEKMPELKDEDALKLVDNNESEFYQYLYFTSAKYIQQLKSSRFEELRKILSVEDEDRQVDAFKKYIGKKDNVMLLKKVFPIMITTCISAHKIGEPKPMFDMTILDEASQCNIAVSLVPIIRGENLMLVGDPQQLNPVILLDEITNKQLRCKYHVADDYDYRKNSIYKTFLACDSVSDEILLHNHYRCHEKIIGFNNKKYYNSKLNVCSKMTEEKPLVYVDVAEAISNIKNTSVCEAREIIRYAGANKDKKIGVITPFVNQKKLIEEELKSEKLENVVCGTVHAFQGDEKDIILFSTAITDDTHAGTYAWLKNNKELINVATSRAKSKLIVLSSMKNLQRLHEAKGDDDLFELINYVRSNGESVVTPKQVNSRALGVKPYSSQTEEAFLRNINHAMENIWLTNNRYVVKKEVGIAHVFNENISYSSLFYNGRFDFVVYEKQGNQEYPVLAIELDGKEHFENEVTMKRDREKQKICDAHNLQLIRVENSYARRYNHIKRILEEYFSSVK